jgi:hypothetical protein
MRSLGWIGFLALATVGFSCGFGCAVPFAAFGAIAALTLSRRAAAGAALLVWLTNQVWQAVALGYPLTPDALRWGAALCILAQLCAAAPRLLPAALHGRAVPPAAITAGAFTLAFVCYEAGLFIIASLLSKPGHLFSPPILAAALGVNALVYAALFAASRLRWADRQTTIPRLA